MSPSWRPPSTTGPVPCGRPPSVCWGGCRPPRGAALLAACPGPWPELLATAVVDRYIHLGARAGLEVPASLSVLAERLDPSVLPLVETWAVALAGDDALRRRVRTLGYALSL